MHINVIQPVLLPLPFFFLSYTTSRCISTLTTQGHRIVMHHLNLGNNELISGQTSLQFISAVQSFTILPTSQVMMKSFILWCNPGHKKRSSLPLSFCQKKLQGQSGQILLCCLQLIIFSKQMILLQLLAL